MTIGMGRPLLMIAESNFLAPFDYRHLLRTFRNAEDAERIVLNWLQPLATAHATENDGRKTFASQNRLAIDLKAIKLGQYVAENEPEEFVDSYFVETAAYLEAIAGNTNIFVGRKGVGKTANLLKIASELQDQKTNLVVVIRPEIYEFQSLVRLLGEYKHRDAKAFAIESIWKFLILSEIANVAGRAIIKRTTHGFTQDEQEFLGFLDADGGLIREEFSIRLERAIKTLTKSGGKDYSLNVESTRVAISEALHSGLLRRLRLVLQKVLKSWKRVTILVDNLDKAWDQKSNLEDLSNFLFGLLNIVDRIPTELQQSGSRSFRVTLTIFLRSDIYYRVTKFVSEPDKLPHTRLDWNDKELLLRVVEDRFVASFNKEVAPANLWQKYFAPEVSGLPARDYIIQRILPRPRDLIFFIKSAVEIAINRKHSVVEASDIIEAEKRYSDHALKSVLVENDVSSVHVSNLISEFIGGTPLLSRSELDRAALAVDIPADQVEDSIKELLMLSFLGIKVRAEEYRFIEEPEELVKLQKLGARYAESNRTELHFMINRPFWAYLELDSSDLNTPVASK